MNDDYNIKNNDNINEEDLIISKKVTQVKLNKRKNFNILYVDDYNKIRNSDIKLIKEATDIL